MQFGKKILIIAFSALVATGLYLAFGLAYKEPNKPPINIASAETGLPLRLIIPEIGVDAKIQYVKTTANGAIGAPEEPWAVAWFSLSQKPGETGSAIITGHYGQWKNGQGSVFHRLNEIKNGSKIYIENDGNNLLSFEVKETRAFDFEDETTEIFGKNDGAWIVLITCQGKWLKDKKTYSERLAVFAKLEN
ncbi:MAG: class F sortase [Candidatus Staskawiczbacteria bacterium]|nr:class F sortase [Candidatus Staskawiczbacteria bacterium]